MTGGRAPIVIGLAVRSERSAKHQGESSAGTDARAGGMSDTYLLAEATGGLTTLERDIERSTHESPLDGSSHRAALVRLFPRLARMLWDEADIGVVTGQVGEVIESATPTFDFNGLMHLDQVPVASAALTFAVPMMILDVDGKQLVVEHADGAREALAIRHLGWVTLGGSLFIFIRSAGDLFIAWQVADGHPWSGDDHADEGVLPQLVHGGCCAIVMLGQRIIQRQSERASRTARRMLQRAHASERAITVYHLRKYRTDDAASAGEHIEWSHRWWVRGSWAHRWTGIGRTTLRQVWVNPYIKGPEDKPLLPPHRRLILGDR